MFRYYIISLLFFITWLSLIINNFLSLWRRHIYIWWYFCFTCNNLLTILPVMFWDFCSFISIFITNQMASCFCCCLNCSICSRLFSIITQLCLYILLKFFLIVRLSPSNKTFFICFNGSSSKMMKSVFYFSLKTLLVLKFLSWFFGHVEKMAWFEGQWFFLCWK